MLSIIYFPGFLDCEYEMPSKDLRQYMNCMWEPDTVLDSSEMEELGPDEEIADWRRVVFPVGV